MLIIFDLVFCWGYLLFFLCNGNGCRGLIVFKFIFNNYLLLIN